MIMSKSIEEIRAKINKLKRERATRPSFGKQRSRDKDGFTKQDREDFKAWKAMREKGEV